MKSKKDKWIKILTDWENSELIRAEYCRQKNIPISTFDYWRQRIRKDAEGLKPEKPFVKLPVVFEPEKQLKVVFEYPSGHKIHFPSGYSAEEIKRVATALRELF